MAPLPTPRQGYATDQFANFNDYEKGTPQADGQDNPPFAYPGNRIPNVYDRAGESRTNTLVQRGFIRGIFPEILEEAAKTDASYKSAVKDVVTRRCFFQFNPALILRSVDASTTTFNPLLQPITELLQPIPGQAAFEFQLLFNREREVSNHRLPTGFDDDGDPTMTKVSAFAQDLKDYGAKGTNPYKLEHVADLGVLADLYVLDSIIGQSITQDSITTLQNYWDIAQKNRVGSTTTVENQDGTTTTTVTSPNGDVVVTIKDKDGKTKSVVPTKAPANSFGKFDFKGQDTKEKLASVLGNSAFLSPLPVRIVFSSLFMVEGYINSSAVAFHKFSNTMIPTVCSVTLNVQALYLGFAKKNSYVSQQLATQITATKETKAAQVKAEANAKEAMRNGLKLTLNHVIPHGSNIGDSLNSWWSSGTTNDWKYTGIGNGARFDSGTTTTSNQGIVCSITDELSKNIKNNSVQDIKIDKIELIFINKDKIPPKDRNAAYVEKHLNAGWLAGGRGKIVEFLRTEINIVPQVFFNTQNNGPTSNGKPAGEAIETADIEKSTAKKPIKKSWQSTPLQTGIPATNRFGTTNIMVAVVVRMSCTYPFEEVDKSVERAIIWKSKVLDNVDPTTAAFITNSKLGKIKFSV